MENRRTFFRCNRIALATCSLIALFAVLWVPTALSAQEQGTGVGPAIWVDPDGSRASIVESSGARPPTRSGPIYACYFADQYTDGRGEARQGEDFLPDTTAPELVQGQWYARQCEIPGPGGAGTGVVADFGIIQYDPGVSDLPGGLTDSQLADHLRDERRLPAQAIPLNLSPDGAQVVAVETWIGLDGPREIGPVWAESGAIRAGLRGRLSHINVRPGDGSPEFVCTDPTSWTPGATNPTCSHTYWEEPASGTYDLTLTYVWDYEWLPNGAADGAWVPFFTEDIVDVIAVDINDLEAVIRR